MAKGKHQVPFRTRKISSSAPMVLRGGPRGRVGRRRTYFRWGRSRSGGGPNVLCCHDARAEIVAGGTGVSNRVDLSTWRPGGKLGGRAWQGGGGGRGRGVPAGPPRRPARLTRPRPPVRPP